MSLRLAFAFAAFVTLACGSSDSSPTLDFSGQYTGTSTTGTSTCPGSWSTGAMAEGEVVITQSGDDVHFQGQNATAIVFGLVYGHAGFTGKAAGSHVDAAIVGSVMNTQGACSYTWKGTISADLSGDSLTGKLTDTPNSNGHADCDTHKVTGCARLMDFKYTRMPK